MPGFVLAAMLFVATPPVKVTHASQGENAKPTCVVPADTVPPKMKKHPVVDYTRIPSRELRHVEARVFLADLFISKEGRVTAIHVLQSPTPAFEKLYLEGLKTATFTPGKRHGKAVESCMTMTMWAEVR
ncbi:MAG: hypothetical protein JOZ54_07860 [Acidobacteria bacterium]|nr:hypothetical protein [Acidobacteriota bacterium]